MFIRVCSVHDMDIYPADCDVSSSEMLLYRKNEIDLYFRNADLLEDMYQHIMADIAELRDQLINLDRLGDSGIFNA